MAETLINVVNDLRSYLLIYTSILAELSEMYKRSKEYLAILKDLLDEIDTTT